MHDFDHDALYYRVLGEGPGYVYRTGEPEEIAGGTKVYGHPFYEFDDLESVGRWLFLGDRVLVLRAPAGALVAVNRPMSQGGCMTYSASRVERVGLLSFAELMRTYEAAGVRPWCLHLAGQDFARDPLTLPACGLDDLYLDRCSGPIDLSRVTRRVALWRSLVAVSAWPASLGELDISGGRVRGELPRARSLSLSGAALDDAVVPAGCASVSLFDCSGRVDLSAARASLSLTKCTLDVTGIAATIDRLSASDCLLGGISALPAGAVHDCEFA